MMTFASFRLRFSKVAVAFSLAVAAHAADAQARFTPDFFGLNLFRPTASEAWPDVPFGSWRLWDAQVTWPMLQPERAKWNFELLDRYVEEAQRHQVKLMLVLAHSPSWASARPDERSAYRPGYASEPAQMSDWATYVRTVATRYKGRLLEYQIWNEPSDRSHFTGTVDNLVELTCSAHRILKQIDPAIRVVSAGSAGGKHHIQFLDSFLSRGGARCIDVVSHHFYVPRLAPEAMIPMIREVRSVMAKNNVGHLPLWSTEIGWWLANEDGTPDHEMVAKGGWRKIGLGDEVFSYLTRAHLLARSEGISRIYWYSWRNQYGWGLSNRATGAAKSGVDRWGLLSGKIKSGTLRNCVAGSDHWRCIVDVSGESSVVKTYETIELFWDVKDSEPREGASEKSFSTLSILNRGQGR